MLSVAVQDLEFGGRQVAQCRVNAFGMDVSTFADMQEKFMERIRISRPATEPGRAPPTRWLGGPAEWQASGPRASRSGV
jgi:hypothetical protein